MFNRVVLDVEMDKKLEDYGADRIILYDNTKNRYYVTTKSSIVGEQNTKIAQLEANFATFKTDMEGKFNEFLETYQATNATILQMVRATVLEEDN